LFQNHRQNKTTHSKRFPWESNRANEIRNDPAETNETDETDEIPIGSFLSGNSLGQDYSHGAIPMSNSKDQRNQIGSSNQWITDSISRSQPQKSSRTSAVQHDPERDAAIGGAVGSLVLGLISIPGSLVTAFSMINALIGLGLGFWGMNSPRRRLAQIGRLLCLIAFLIAVLKCLQWDQSFFQWWIGD
jgi:hypothetical protein